MYEKTTAVRYVALGWAAVNSAMFVVVAFSMSELGAFPAILAAACACACGAYVGTLCTRRNQAAGAVPSGSDKDPRASMEHFMRGVVEVLLFGNGFCQGLYFLVTGGRLLAMAPLLALILLAFMASFILPVIHAVRRQWLAAAGNVLALFALGPVACLAAFGIAVSLYGFSS